MKKFLIFLLVAVVAVTSAFAIDASKISVGVSTGVVDEVTQFFGKGDYYRFRVNEYGFNLAVRGDYELSESTSVTAVLDYEIISHGSGYHKTNFLAAYYQDFKGQIDDDHTIGVTVGTSKTFGIGKGIDLTVTVGPEFEVSCTSGEVDLGAKGIIKGSYLIPEGNLSVDLSVTGGVYVIKDGDFFWDFSTDTHVIVPTHNAIAVGLTYHI